MTQVDFSSPQRQSKIGLIVLFADTVFGFLKAMWIIIGVFFFRAKTITDVFYGIGFLVVIFVFFAVYAWLKYRYFSFYVDEKHGEFIVNHGVFNKTKTVIQLSKIQQVNLKQNFIQRIIDVYGVDVDTAGSEKKEAVITAVSKEVAMALKVKLLESEYKNEADETIQEADFLPKPFLKISPLSLLKIGITSNYIKSIGLLMTFFFTIYENLKNAGADDLLYGEKIDEFVESNTIIYSILFIVIVFITIIFLVNIIRTLLVYFGYKIADQNGSLILSYGLISTQNTILKPERVQLVKISRNYFQKKLNVLEVKIKQAIGSETDKQKKSTIEIPGCNTAEKDEILKLIFNQLPKQDEMLKPNFRKLFFSIFLIIVLPLTGYFWIGSSFVPEILEYQSIAIAYALFFLLILFAGFRNYRLFVSENHVMLQHGAWDIDKEIIKIEKIQAITTSQLFWHKNLNIGSLTIHTAGGNLSFQLGNFNRMNELVNLWLCQIEKTNKNWM